MSSYVVHYFELSRQMSSCFLSGRFYLTYPQGQLVLHFLLYSPDQYFLTSNQNDPSLSCYQMSKISSFVLGEQLFYKGGRFRRQLHSAIYHPDSFIMMLPYCANLKAIRYESTVVLQLSKCLKFMTFREGCFKQALECKYLSEALGTFYHH